MKLRENWNSSDCLTVGDHLKEVFGHLLANWEIACGEAGIVDAVQKSKERS